MSPVWCEDEGPCKDILHTPPEKDMVRNNERFKQNQVLLASVYHNLQCHVISHGVNGAVHS